MGNSVKVRKVAFVTDFYPEVHSRWSGAEIACQRLRGLLAEDGIEVAVYTARAEFPAKKPPFVEDVRLLENISPALGSSLKTLFPFDPLAYGFFLKRFRDHAPDIVHLHNLKFMSFAPLAAARKLGIPAVFSVYDNWAICPRYCLVKGRGGVCEEFHGLRCVGCVPLKKKPFVPFRRPVFGRFVGKLDALAVLTGSERERYVKSGVSAEKLHILPLPLFEEGEDCRVDEHAVERETILFVGRLEHGKGLHVLVEAMPLVLKRFPEARVRVVGEHSGSDRYKKETLSRIKELGLESVFSFTGKMGNKEIRELLLKSHVVAAPEQWAIAWPIFLTEAMSMGKRVVASKIGDIPEFIREGQTGFLAAHDSHEEFAGKIIAAMEMPEPVNLEASRMIRELCDRKAIKKSLLAIYESAVKKGRP
jgi:glycosyltransferase involved in cell wall biosynthesis